MGLYFRICMKHFDEDVVSTPNLIGNPLFCLFFIVVFCGSEHVSQIQTKA